MHAVSVTGITFDASGKPSGVNLMDPESGNLVQNVPIADFQNTLRGMVANPGDPVQADGANVGVGQLGPSTMGTAPPPYMLAMHHR